MEHAPPQWLFESLGRSCRARALRQLTIVRFFGFSRKLTHQGGTGDVPAIVTLPVELRRWQSPLFILKNETLGNQ
jgi:hypothetical protein